MRVFATSQRAYGIFVQAALDIDSATYGVSSMIVHAAEDWPSEEVLAFVTYKVRQHVIRVQLILDLIVAFLAARARHLYQRETHDT